MEGGPDKRCTAVFGPKTGYLERFLPVRRHLLKTIRQRSEKPLRIGRDSRDFSTHIGNLGLPFHLHEPFLFETSDGVAAFEFSVVPVGVFLGLGSSQFLQTGQLIAQAA